MLSQTFYITLFVYICSLYYIFKYKPKIFYDYIKKENEITNTTEFKLQLETALILIIIIVYVLSLLIGKSLMK
jgi:hypothetical protein